jgi:protein TonB
MNAVNHISVSLKEYYRRYVIGAFAVAVLMHIALFYFTPQFEFQPYTMDDYEPIMLVLPDEIEIPPPPETVDQPVIEIGQMTDDDVGDLAEVPPNVYTDMSEIRTPPSLSRAATLPFTAFDELPVLVRYAAPVYPDLARHAGIEGTVLVKVLIGEDGKVIDAMVLQSDVTHAMERAAVRAALLFVFRPARQRTVPVRASMAVPVVFKLH